MVNGRENESFKELSYQSHLSIGFITNCRLIYIITFNWLYCIQVSSFDRHDGFQHVSEVISSYHYLTGCILIAFTLCFSLCDERDIDSVYIGKYPRTLL